MQTLTEKIKNPKDIENTEEIVELLCKYDVGFWSEEKRGFVNPPHIKEWYLMIDKVIFGQIMRLCVIAPREHAKSEVFAVTTTAWCANYGAEHGINWVYIFSNSQPQANEILDRVVVALMETNPELCYKPSRWERKDKVFTNGFRVTARGAGASVRGAHPDLIVGDDVLSDSNSRSNSPREEIKNWWRRTVTNMAKPTTRIILEGTVQHQLDLLMTLKENPSYVWKSYPAWHEE